MLSVFGTPETSKRTKNGRQATLKEVYGGWGVSDRSMAPGVGPSRPFGGLHREGVPVRRRAGTAYIPAMTVGSPGPHRFDDAPGVVGITRHELPNLPDDVAARPETGRIDPRRWFAESGRRFELEIGSGKGGFLLAQARAHPETNLLGIECEGEFYGYAADRVRRAGLTNVRMLHADATEFVRWRVPDGIVSVIHLYFSDPWPKKRHYKRRVIQDRFLQEAHRVLVRGGELRVVTDHDELWEWDLEHFGRVTAPAERPLFELRPFTPPAWVSEGRLVDTNYERKFAADRAAHSCTLVKALRADG